MNKILLDNLNHLTEKENYNLNHLTREELFILNKILNNIQNRNFIIKNISVNSPEFNTLRRQIDEDNKIVQKIINNNKKRNEINEQNEQELINKMKIQIKDNPNLLNELKRKTFSECQR